LFGGFASLGADDNEALMIVNDKTLEIPFTLYFNPLGR
jgi:hypothetical protein